MKPSCDPLKSHAEPAIKRCRRLYVALPGGHQLALATLPLPSKVSGVCPVTGAIHGLANAITSVREGLECAAKGSSDKVGGL